MTLPAFMAAKICGIQLKGRGGWEFLILEKLLATLRRNRPSSVTWDIFGNPGSEIIFDIALVKYIVELLKSCQCRL